jgi:hypothetical protein
MRSLFAALLTLAAIVKAQLDACPDTSGAEYDYVVVGAGAGGGPLAARLAESGFSGARRQVARRVFAETEGVQQCWWWTSDTT